MGRNLRNNRIHVGNWAGVTVLRTEAPRCTSLSDPEPSEVPGRAQAGMSQAGHDEGPDESSSKMQSPLWDHRGISLV